MCNYKFEIQKTYIAQQHKLKYYNQMGLNEKNIFHHNIALVTINTLSYGYDCKGGRIIYEDGYYNVCSYINIFRINFT